MRKEVCGLVFLLVALFLLSSTVLAGPEGFSGTWVMNKDKSDVLMGPPDGEKPDVTMKVDATKDSVKVSQTFSSSRGEMSMDQAYTPDGKSHEITGPMDSKGTAEASWDGEKLILKTVFKFERNGEEMVMKNDSIWELSADGNVLTIQSKMDSPRGAREGKQVFDKKK